MSLYNNKALLCSGMTFHGGTDRSGEMTQPLARSFISKERLMLKIRVYTHTWQDMHMNSDIKQLSLKTLSVW